MLYHQARFSIFLLEVSLQQTREDLTAVERVETEPMQKAAVALLTSELAALHLATARSLVQVVAEVDSIVELVTREATEAD